ncbi:uncharacterized protein LOC133803792 [Humulus lupulus]|uniref:uncharacterized protein LOC133803792 n=1 Tax=Humulus lupulus TaxID=3486 RepID=UPI002B40E7E4|nr:uncharacterized protein LOC133803792 [Humulus lupulus]
MESDLGMNLTAVLAQHRSIARARARNDELKAELQTAQAALTATQAALVAAQQGEQSAKVALTVAQAGEQAAKVALTAAQEGEQAASAALQAELVGAKAKQLEAEAALQEEKKALTSSMESMLYHCWAFNQDDNFSFTASEAWGHYLEKFKAQLQ